MTFFTNKNVSSGGAEDSVVSAGTLGVAFFSFVVVEVGSTDGAVQMGEISALSTGLVTVSAGIFESDLSDNLRLTVRTGGSTLRFVVNGFSSDFEEPRFTFQTFVITASAAGFTGFETFHTFSVLFILEVSENTVVLTGGVL